MNIDEREFNDFCAYLREASGIALAENKRYLVTTRIKRILQDANLSTISELLKILTARQSSALKQRVVDAMTTNETYWFRDAHPFLYLKSTILPELVANANGSEIKIWCAGCSSGQEAYSIAIIADELQRESFAAVRKPVKILATDISTSMLEAAKAGIYDKISVLRGLDEERLLRYFEPIKEQSPIASRNLGKSDPPSFRYTLSHAEVEPSVANQLVSGDRWQVKPNIRNRVEYRALNMIDSYLHLGKFDIIFCRNILIYFSGDLKQDILRRLHACLNPGGYLFLGSSEGLGNNTELFEMVYCNPGVVYRAR